MLMLLEAEPLTGLELLGNEAIKAIPNAVVAGIGALLALWVGKRVSHHWAVRQKEREIELTALNEYYRLYGEFISLRRLWNKYNRDDSRQRQASNNDHWQFLERAAELESRIESLLVKIAVERKLSDQDIDDLGLLRQAFQSLRERIRDDEPVVWGYSGHAEYLEFKSLPSRLAEMFLSDSISERPSVEEAVRQINSITDNRHEQRWRDLGAREEEKQRGRSVQERTG